MEVKLMFWTDIIKQLKNLKPKILLEFQEIALFIDPEVIDKAVNLFKKNKFDYVSNTIEPTYPDGLDVEIFNFKSLEKIMEKSKNFF